MEYGVILSERVQAWKYLKLHNGQPIILYTSSSLANIAYPKFLFTKCFRKFWRTLPCISRFLGTSSDADYPEEICYLLTYSLTLWHRSP